jgi:hypothetical protein
MKTFWKQMLPHAQAREKQLTFEQKTGVKWDFWSAHGGTAFCPIVTRSTPMDETAAAALLPWLTVEYQRFDALAEISGLGLPAVVSGAKTLAQTQRAVANVNRMGNFAYIRSKRKGEK